MKGNLILNHNNDLAFLYGDPLAFTPEWVSIDVEQQEIYISNNDQSGDGNYIKFDKINQDIYERIQTTTQILLVLMKDNDITKPLRADWLPIMVSQQI